MRGILTAAVVLLAIGSAARRRAPRRAPGRSGSGSASAAASSRRRTASTTRSICRSTPETERVTVDYPVEGGALIAASGGYRVWKRLTIGLGVTRYSRRSDGDGDARACRIRSSTTSSATSKARRSTTRGETGGAPAARLDDADDATGSASSSPPARRCSASNRRSSPTCSSRRPTPTTRPAFTGATTTARVAKRDGLQRGRRRVLDVLAADRRRRARAGHARARDGQHAGKDARSRWTPAACRPRSGFASIF